MAPDNASTLPHGITSWDEAVAWHRCLNSYTVADVPAVPGLTVVAHVQGLFPGHAKLYALCRTRRKTFVGFVASFADSPPLETTADLYARQRLVTDLKPADVVRILAEREPVFRMGHRSALRAFTDTCRRSRRDFVHPALGTMVLYPLRFPTLVRDFGLDPTHPAYGVRRDWMTVVDLGRRAGLMPTGEVFTAFLEQETERVQAALAPARNLIDREAVAVMGRATQFRQATYHFYKGRGPRAETRRQAARAYPMFARAISEIPALRRAVDGRHPLVPALARSFQVSEATIRCLHTFPHKAVPDHVEYLLLFLEDIDGSLCPGRRYRRGARPDADPWACFATLAQELNSLASFIGGRRGRSGALRDLLRHFDGDWCALFREVGGERMDPVVPVTRVPESVGSDDPLEPRQRAQDEERIAGAVAWDHYRRQLRLPWSGDVLRDGARAFAYAVCLPVAAHDSGCASVTVDPPALRLAEAVAVRFVLGGRTLPQIVRFAERFHRSIGRLFPHVSLRNVQAASLAWSRPSPPVASPGGLTLVPLGSVQDLVEEGAALGNCLPLYAVPCAIEGHRVVSVRREGRRIAAFEIVRPAPRHPWTVRQIEGPANRPAPAEAHEAARWYVGWLNEQGEAASIPADATQGDTDVLWALCGYDWREAAALKAMWDLWVKPPRLGDGEDPMPAVLPRSAVRRGLRGLRGLEDFIHLRERLKTG